MTNTKYNDFLKSKVVISENFGFDTSEEQYNDIMFPHQVDVVDFCLKGGRRAIFASFGLGKTFMQLEIARILIQRENKPFLIVCPLGVSGEFKRDNIKLNTGLEVTYITDTDKIGTPKNQIYITNYERVRMGDIDANIFCGVSFDEASILRNLQTDTTNYVLKHFRNVPFRFVATATPTPNDYIEILNYADYLGVISRGHALTRFFQRDSTKAGQLKLYENKKDEFWKWVSTWAVFLNSPADLGYDSTGYDLPELEIVEHCLDSVNEESYVNQYGELVMFKDKENSFHGKAEERRNTIKQRCDKAYEIAKQCVSAVIWHELNSEMIYLESLFKNEDFRSVYGSQTPKQKEELLIGFSEGKYKYLLTKKKIAGSGCNFQHTCHEMIFCSIDDKFNDWWQAVHRIYRFRQTKKCIIHLVYTKDQHKSLQTLYRKMAQHKEQQEIMIKMVRENGLNSEIIKSQMERQIFANGRKLQFDNVTIYNNDTVIVHQDKKEMPDNSIDMYLTSIPFGDHYEYSDNYNDFGHNHGNDKFFEQMDYLTPEILRCLKPGRIAAIHVKDRIRYSYQNGTSFTTISDFSGQTVSHFVKHGFYLMGKITVTTDVVAENNQTYRLGWTEQCKDASKMGVGLPEYVLLFRKAPTHMDNAYADTPITKEKEEYTKALWQLDAHAYYRSSGDRFLTTEELRSMEVRQIVAAWKQRNLTSVYDFNEHLRICEDLDEMEKLSSTFMTLPVHSNSEMVWTDVNRMKTLNANQVSSKKEKHICPLQFDIIERLINRYTMKGEVVCDPFGGLFSTAYKCIELDRKCVSIELNSEYFNDGLYYLKAMMHKLSVPTLFDLIEVA